MIPNVVLFSGRLFRTQAEPATPTAAGLRDARILKICDEAEASLRAVSRESCDLLLHTAWNDLRDGLAMFLEHLLLLKPDHDQIQSIVRAWVEAQHEMLSRLHADRQALKEFLLSECGRIAAVETDLSDRHDSGRTVAILTFESGARVVYKPRDMGIEDWYCRFAAWLNASGAPLPVRAARVVARVGYGWMEFVPHLRCQSKEELARFYQNAGALLCVLHLLRARDCHFQNLIACGAEPVLVDAEMLFQPQLSDRESIAVTQTGMIPAFRFGPEGQHYDISGLGFVEAKETHFRVPVWSGSGMQYVAGVLDPKQNVPMIVDEPARPQDYVAEMVDGFSETCRFFSTHRDALREWVRAAAALRVRYLIRETMEYYEALHFDLGGEAASTIMLPALAADRMIFSALVQQEIASLGQLDIPRFSLDAAGRSLPGLEGCFHRSGLELALSEIEELSEKDLAKQVQHIRLSWSFSQISSALAQPKTGSSPDIIPSS